MRGRARLQGCWIRRDQLLNLGGNKMVLKGTPTLFSHLSPCHAEVDCGHPGAPPHATMSGEKFTSGSTVRFSCSGERQLIGEPSLSCQLSGHWSAPLPHCSGAPTHKQIGSWRRPDTQPRAASRSELFYLFLWVCNRAPVFAASSWCKQ